jgi:hypothetical protein
MPSRRGAGRRSVSSTAGDQVEGALDQAVAVERDGCGELGKPWALDLAAGLTRGVVLGDLTAPSLDIPTTATVSAGRLSVTNRRFTTPPLRRHSTGSSSCRSGPTAPSEAAGASRSDTAGASGV